MIAIFDVRATGNVSGRSWSSRNRLPRTAVQPGDTWNFQCWYRDNNPGPTSNFTDAVTVVLQ
ncbi:MAG: hypothetical protein GY733_03545 [bacterium]|nr:hypothetical protein [bacterium]